MDKEYKLVLIALSLFALGYVLGLFQGTAAGENTGLRAQDSAVIKVLGTENANLNTTIKTYSSVLQVLSKADTTGNTLKYLKSKGIAK